MLSFSMARGWARAGTSTAQGCSQDPSVLLPNEEQNNLHSCRSFSFRFEAKGIVPGRIICAFSTYLRSEQLCRLTIATQGRPVSSQWCFCPGFIALLPKQSCSSSPFPPLAALQLLSSGDTTRPNTATAAPCVGEPALGRTCLGLVLGLCWVQGSLWGCGRRQRLEHQNSCGGNRRVFVDVLCSQTLQPVHPQGEGGSGREERQSHSNPSPPSQQTMAASGCDVPQAKGSSHPVHTA